jgi:hypothetical protein
MTRIGLDLDNTLVSYDALFLEIAQNRDLVPLGFSGSKREIRDYIRLLPHGEKQWTRLQAHVYGPAMLRATATPGALDFVRRAREHGVEMVIVSHKSEYAAAERGGPNLREAARAWLLRSGLVGPNAIPESSVYFEGTRSEKIARIVALRCTHFIDDLEEVFDDPAFPPDVHRVLITQTSFAEIARTFFGD